MKLKASSGAEDTKNKRSASDSGNASGKGNNGKGNSGKENSAKENAGSGASGKETPTGKKERRKRINPATCPVGELTARLGTDPQNGLTPKEASRRLTRDGRGGLFHTDRLTVKDCIARLAREPVLWLFLAVCIIALFFDRWMIGLACALLTVGHAAVCVLALRRAGQIDDAMQVYDRPLCRVVRGGSVRRISADGLVKGDIILLAPGDIVPADARLLSVTGDLVITERELDGNEAHRHTVRLRKNPDATVVPGTRFLHSPDNMVWAGGIVESGSARAVVAAVGKNTHLAGLSGGLGPAHPSKNPKGFRKAERVLSVWNLILVVLVIPFIIVGIFTVGSTHDLLELMLSALSLGVISLTSRWMVLGTYAGASLRDTAATDRDADNTADIKNSATLDPLSRMDELVLIGTVALHDGILHPETLTVGCPDGQETEDGSLPLPDSYDCTRPGADATASRFCEGLYLYGRGLNAAMSDYAMAMDEHTASVLACIDTVCGWAELDTTATMQRVSQLTVRVTPDGKTCTTAVFTSGQTVTYRLAHSFAGTATCTLIAGHRYHPIRDSEREALRTAARQAELSGNRLFFLLSERDGQACMEGMLVCAPHVCRRTRSMIRTMEASGLRVTAFLRNVSRENTRVLSECGLTETAPADRPVRGQPRRPAAERCAEGVRAFEGCDTSFIADYIAARRAEGHIVGVLSGGREDLPLIGSGDVALTVAPDLYASAFAGDAHLRPDPYVTEDGGADGSCATDLCRRRADIIVRRSGVSGGGVAGVCQALHTAERVRHGVRSALRYLAVSYLARLLTVLITLCTGLTLIGGPFILLSGLCVDLLVAFSLVHADDARAARLADAPATGTAQRKENSPAAPDRRGLFAFLARPWETYLPELIAAAFAAITPWIIVGVYRLFHAAYIGDLQAYAFLSLWTIQFAAFLTDRSSWRHSRMGLWTIVALLCVLAGGIAVALSVGLRLLWTLVLPLAAGAVFCVVYCIARLALRKKS